MKYVLIAILALFSLNVVAGQQEMQTKPCFVLIGKDYVNPNMIIAFRQFSDHLVIIDFVVDYGDYGKLEIEVGHEPYAQITYIQRTILAIQNCK